jgi:hypothetical protein
MRLRLSSSHSRKLPETGPRHGRHQVLRCPDIAEQKFRASRSVIAAPAQPVPGRARAWFPLAIVRSVRTWGRGNGQLIVESVAFGLGYTAVLIWSGAALVASFSGGESSPYWPAVPGLRTDSAGVIAFAVAIVSLSVSKYLQLRRRSGAPVRPVGRSSGVLAVQAMAETAVFLGTGLVIYLSLNAVTHPETLRLQLTHLWPWPSEGTVRVIALGFCLVGVATRRYLRATAGRPIRAASVPGKADVAAEDPDLPERGSSGAVSSFSKLT